MFKFKEGLMKKSAFFLVILLMVSGLCSLSADYLRLTSPRGGWTDQRIITISGETDADVPAVQVVYNSIPLRLPVNNGRFSRDFVTAPGLNTIYAEVISKGKVLSDNVSFYSDVPSKAMKIVLMWDTNQTDVDLHVYEPSGEECYYGHKQTEIGGALDVDITTGYGPEVYTLATPTKGSYKISAYYYSDQGNPQTQATVYVVLYEGTPNERIITFETMLTKTEVEIFIDTVTLE
jgi:uncharacterized protein YfaP (DUF2135 family)